MLGQDKREISGASSKLILSFLFFHNHIPSESKVISILLENVKPDFCLVVVYLTWATEVFFSIFVVRDMISKRSGEESDV